jgi:hypothetical protein
MRGSHVSLMVEAVRTSETSVNILEDFLEDSKLHKWLASG